MSLIGSVARTAFHESGLQSVVATGPDAWLILASRSCRMFSYGAGSLVLALFFAELGTSDARIGLFMTLTLLGDVALGLALTQVADRGLGRRRTLLVGGVLMVASGVVFVVAENYWALLAAAVVGVLSATGGDFGPFRAIEESAVAELTTPATRADVLVWYVTLASFGSALGVQVAGRLVDHLTRARGWPLRRAYHAVFALYVLMGLLNIVFNRCLSHRCELREPSTRTETDATTPSDETRPLLLPDPPHASTSTAVTGAESGDESDRDAAVPVVPEKKDTPPSNRYVSQISRETLSVMTVLWFLLMVDSVADGMVSMSLTTYYLDDKFAPAKSTLGNVMSAAYLLAAGSNVLAGPLARRIGLVNTMVFTHVPSSAAVLLFPLPQTLTGAFALLLVRVGLNNMDQAPRAALIAAVVRPEERTAVLGITVLLRTLASVTGPSVTGLLAQGGRFWVAFVAAGALRLAYDLGLFTMFINIQLYRHEPAHPESTTVQGSDESDREPEEP